MPIVEIDLKTFKKQSIKLKLIGIKEFSLFDNNVELSGFLVSHYKLFIEGELIYFCIDPYVENKKIAVEDNYYFLFKGIEIVEL